MLPPGLSMLWEPAQPETALTERFGFDGLGAVADWVAAELRQTWGIEVRSCERMVISDQNAIVWVTSDQGGLVVKWSRAPERFARLDATTRMLRTLARQGLPVASPAPTVAGLDRTVVDGPLGALSASVLPELAGDWLDVTDLVAVHAAGACLAALHEGLTAVAAIGASLAAPPVALTHRIGRWLVVGDRGLAPRATQRLRDLLEGLSDLRDPPQVVHNDYRAANILTRRSAVVGVLDFDDAMVDHRICDVAKACVYLSTRFTDWQPTSTTVRDALCAGYESVRPFSTEESRWLEALVLWQGILAIPAHNDSAGWAAAL